MGPIIYYLILKPLSLLPLWVLHLFSDVLFILSDKVIPYRRKVVEDNLRRCFPQLSDKEITTLRRKFYAHFCDLILESVKVFSISKKQAAKRFVVVNPELLDKYYEQGRSVVLSGGHYNNWEMAAVAVGFQIKAILVGIYAPLTNKYFDKKFFDSRSKFGLELIGRNEVKERLKQNHEEGKLTVTVFAGDQSPTYSKKVYWTDFLGQDTAVMFGTEKYAREYDSAVLFANIRKVKRGYYELILEEIEEFPNEVPMGQVTEKHTRALERQILANPEYWLWTHKRWKRKREHDEFPDEQVSKN